MDVEQLGNIVVALERVLLPEGGADGRRLLLDKGALICYGLER